MPSLQPNQLTPPSRKGFKYSNFAWNVAGTILLAIAVAMTILLARGSFDGWSARTLSDMEIITEGKSLAMWSYFYNTGNIFGVLIIAAGVLIIPKARQRYGIPVAAVVAITQLISFVLRVVAPTERPRTQFGLITASGPSFPCGEVMSWVGIFAFFYLSLWYFGRKDYPDTKSITRQELDYLEATTDSLTLTTRAFMMMACLPIIMLPPMSHAMMMLNHTIDIIISSLYGLSIAFFVMGFIVKTKWGIKTREELRKQ